MSRKPTSTSSKKGASTALVPKLRFPEFRGVWEKKTLETLGYFTGGGTPSKDNAAYWTGEIPWISSSDLNEDSISQINITRFITRQAVQESATKVVPAKSILLISRVGVGKLAVSTFPLCTSQDFTNFTPTDASPLFLAYLLKSQKETLLSFNQGTSIKGFTKDNIASLQLGFPTRAEQQRISSCLSSLDSLITAHTRKLNALKTYKKGLMQQLFPREGETVPRLRFPEFRGAGEWEIKKLDDLLHFQDGFSFKSTDFVAWQEDATQVIRITDINNKNTNAEKVYIPSAFLEANKLSKYNVNDGDLLLSLTGAAGFNFYFWKSGPATINQRTAKVTTKNKAGRALLRLLEPLIHERINARGEGQNNNLSKEFLSSIVLIIPEPAEQQRIASCLTTLDDLITAQSRKLAALKTHKKGLMQGLFPNPDEQNTL